jgi:hypothetical protein
MGLSLCFLSSLPPLQLKTVYDHGPVDCAWESFDGVKARVDREWKATPKLHDPVSKEMYAKVKKWCADFDVEYEKMMASC